MQIDPFCETLFVLVELIGIDRSLFEQPAQMFDRSTFKVVCIDTRKHFVERLDVSGESFFNLGIGRRGTNRNVDIFKVFDNFGGGF